MKEKFSNPLERAVETEQQKLQFIEKLPGLEEVSDVFKQHFWEDYTQYQQELTILKDEEDELFKNKPTREEMDSLYEKKNDFYSKWSFFKNDLWELANEYYSEQEKNSYNCYSFCLSLMKKSGMKIEEIIPDPFVHGGMYVDENGNYFSAEDQDEAERSWYESHGKHLDETEKFYLFQENLKKDSTLIELESSTSIDIRNTIIEKGNTPNKYFKEKAEEYVQKIIELNKEKKLSRYGFFEDSSRYEILHMFCMMNLTPDGQDILCIEKSAIGTKMRFLLLSELLEDYISSGYNNLFLGLPKNSPETYYPSEEELKAKQEEQNIKEEEIKETSLGRRSGRKRRRKKQNTQNI